MLKNLTIPYSIIISFLLFHQGYAQTVHYSINRGDKKIGEITASRNASAKTCNYDISSTATFTVVWKYNHQTNMHVVYKNDVLEESVATKTMNEDLEELCKTRRANDNYICFRHPDDSFELNAPITFSTAMLYFREPVGVHKIYSESHLAYCDLIAVGEHKYKLVLPEEKINYYTYADHQLVEIFVDRTWFDIVFTLMQ